ncbi:MAG TPA: hypothetical protein VFU22_16550 [Roseiflexaceae bacterium]|nr:hypothetical protein [Roseiflexaceae bacterium]
MAWATESGLTLICPTTKLAYMPERVLIETDGGTRYIQSRCRHCDSCGRIRQDRDFDPSNPQVHTHILTSSPKQTE